MGPHPEVPVDVQKYIGTCLITQQQFRPKRKTCPTLPCDKGAPSLNGYCTSSALSVCNSCCTSEINGATRYHNIKNYAWTGLPLISIANTRQRFRSNTKQRILPSIGKPTEWERMDYVPSEYSNCSMPNLEDVLPISRLAIHAQGAPLIISSGDRDKLDKSLEFRRDISASERRDGYLGCIRGNGTSSRSPPISVMMNSSASSYYRDDEANVYGDTSRQITSPLPSDSVSTTSEDSGTSENGLPRIIKPRKRRKKEHRMSSCSPQINDDNERATSGKAIVTLKPYQPLCYGYTDTSSGNFILPWSSSSSKEHNSCDIPSRRTRRALKIPETTKYPYPSSHLCGCPYCIPPPATLITPPDSPVSVQESWKLREHRSSMCDVGSPRCSPNLEIKFLPSCSDEDAINLEDFVAAQALVVTSSHPPQRPWVRLTESSLSFPSSCTFTVMCYNILCDKYATRQMYGYCPNWALEWNYRKKNIMHEIRHYKADILSLQEVETEQFYHFFLPELKKDGYDGIFSPKSRAKTMSESDRKHVDGCAIFFKTNKFFLIKEYLVEFNQLAMANAEGSDDMLNRVMTKDNIGLAALLQTRMGAYDCGGDPTNTNQTLLVCTAHIHWDPEYSDVKLIQTMMLMHELQSIVEDTLGKCSNPNVQKDDLNSIPLLLCGDFNSLPNSGVIEFLSHGRVSVNHCDFKEFAYEDCLRKLGTSLKANEFTHTFRISRAYSNDIMPFTNYSYDFKGVIDYVFYSELHMSVLGVLGPVDSTWLQENRVQGCPHPHVPSDHFPILVELQLAPTLPIHPPPPNGITSHR